MSEIEIDDKVVRGMFGIAEGANVAEEYKRLAVEVFTYGGPVSSDLQPIWDEHKKKMQEKFPETTEKKWQDMSFLVEQTVGIKRGVEKLEAERKTTKDPERIEYIDDMVPNLKELLVLQRKKIQISCTEIAPELLELALKNNQPIEDVVNKYLWLKKTRDDYDMLSMDKELMRDTKDIDNEAYKVFEKDATSIRNKLDKLYVKINPELAALREEEKEKVEKGMDPKQAQKERRNAVKDYYNKKSPIER